ncbi:acetyl-CoA carboxylase biotin carboxyl carrier protein, partial [Acidithiobacillus ferriphilus]
MTASNKNWDGLTEAIQSQAYSDGISSMAINYAEVLEILRLIDSTSNISKLSLSLGDIQIEVERGARIQPQVAPVEAVGTTGMASERGQPSEPKLQSPVRQESEQVLSGEAAVRAPIAGIFYRSPMPDEPPFVEVGDAIEEDTIIGIVEVMKVMNNIRAGTRGIVREICAENEQLIQFDQVI